MKLNRRGKLLLSAMIGTMASGIAAVYSVFTFFILTNKVSDDGDGRGNVGLRSYFHTGIGTAARPFVITRPRHFYNLARLQNLGAFSEETVFQLGYDLTSGGKGNNNGVLDDGEKWLVYAGDTGNDTTQVLDMSGSFYRNTIFPIGSEGAPFYGEFKGNDLVISGLTVTSFPEDVGVFGYTAAGSYVHNLFFKNLTIEDDGWDKMVLNPSFYSPAANSYTLGATLNDSTVVSADGSWLAADKPITAGTTTITISCTGIPSTYSPKFRCSSAYMVEDKNTAGKFSFNLSKVASDTGLTGTTSGNVYSRLSVCSNYSTGGHLYSHVLGTFTVNIKYDGSGNYSFNVKRDVFNSNDTTNDSMSVTNYKHGANIGFVFGHCDGKAQEIYVDGGSLKMNNGNIANRQVLEQESETGLIGEVGASLDKEGTPNSAYQNNSETGVVNFSGIYENIMPTYGTANAYHQVSVGHNGPGDTNWTTEFGQYTDFVPVASKSSNYLEYLRQNQVLNNGETVDHYFTDYYPNSYYQSKSTPEENISFSYNLDFAGRNLIADTRDESGKVVTARGLGVFKMATGKTDNNPGVLGLQMRNTSEFQIKRGRVFDEVFYTTAEYDSTTEIENDNTSWFNNWKTGETNGTRIFTPSTLPTFVTEHTWNQELEKTTNYVFRTSLADNQTMNDKNYFGNAATSNDFIKEYFRYKLITSGGTKVPITDNNFGVKIQTASQNKNEKPINITSFDSYLYCTESKDRNGVVNDIASCPVNKTEEFTGNGETTLFTLINKPLKKPTITVDGVDYTDTLTWSTNSNDISFGTAPANKAKILVSYVYDSFCPSGTINFSIKNTFGANVTIIAGASSQNTQYCNDEDHSPREASYDEQPTASIISIYDKETSRNGSTVLDPTDPNLSVRVSKFSAVKPSYSTYMPLLGTKKEDFRFFDYNHVTGAVNPSATLSTDEKYLGVDPSGHNEILYAHTFKIPKAGDYFIYSPTGNTKLYYVCAQGQDQGEIGDSSSNYSGDNAIKNVDFVRAVPGDLTYSTTGQARYHLSFKGYWTNGSGTMTIGNYDDSRTSPIDITSASNQESIIIWNNSIGQTIYYNGHEHSDDFITEGGH